MNILKAGSAEIKRKNKALFLDRDGVINKDYGHVWQIEDFELVAGITDVIKAAMDEKYKIIIVTNQAGIGKGMYAESDFEALTGHMKILLKSQGCNIDSVYFCPFHPTEGKGLYLKDSFDRKPNPGMFLRAKNDFNLDMGASILIGDKVTDIQAGQSAGVAINILYDPRLTEESIPHGCKKIKTLKQVLDFL